MLLRTDSQAPDFIALQKLLDQELWEMYPMVMHQYVEHNILPEATPALIYYKEEQAVAIGAFKEQKQQNAIEIKRMYVHPDFRGQQLGVIILKALEDWGRELGYPQAILETGLKNYAAHKLYDRNGYQRIDNYEPFVGLAESWCYGKKLVD